jgi:hypothetical protein
MLRNFVQTFLRGATILLSLCLILGAIFGGVFAMAAGLMGTGWERLWLLVPFAFFSLIIGFTVKDEAEDLFS